MPYTHNGVVGEIVYIDPDAAAGPYTIVFPQAPLENNDRFSVSTTTFGVTPVTFDPTGSAPIHHPVLGDITVPFATPYPEATGQYVYNAIADKWYAYTEIAPRAIPLAAAYNDIDSVSWDALQTGTYLLSGLGSSFSNLPVTLQAGTTYGLSVNLFNAITTNLITQGLRIETFGVDIGNDSRGFFRGADTHANMITSPWGEESFVPVTLADTFNQIAVQDYTVLGTAINLQKPAGSLDWRWELTDANTMTALADFFGTITLTFDNIMALTANNADLNVELRLGGTATIIKSSFFDSFAHARTGTFTRTWTQSSTMAAGVGQTVTVDAFEVDSVSASIDISNLLIEFG